MALTLDATLLTAQTATSRHPICELTIGKGVDDLPLSASPGLSPDTKDQYAPSSLALSDGRLAVFYWGKDLNLYSGKDLRVVFSDADLTEYDNYTALYSGTLVDVSYMDAIVLDANDNMGVVARVSGPSGTGLRFVKVSSAGVVLNNTLVSDSGTFTGVTAVKVADDSYAVVYAKNSSGTYSFYTRTSTNWTSWGTETAITIGGLTAGREVKDLKIQKLADNSYLLVFSYQDIVDDSGSIYNIYYSTSADLSTWTDAAPVTDNTGQNRDYSQPDIVQTEDGDLLISMLESNTYLSMTSNTTGWIKGSRFQERLDPYDTWLDEAAGKLYVMSYSYSGFRGAAKIDLATWTIDKCYSGYSTPAIPTYFRDGNSNRMGRQRGEKHLAPIVCSGGVCLLDFDADDYTAFFFYDYSSEYGPDHAQNVTWSDVSGQDIAATIISAQADVTNNRLWVMLVNAYYYDNGLQIGYIDLDQTGPTYEFTSVIKGEFAGGGDAAYADQFRVYPDDDFALVYGASQFGGRLKVLKLSSNAVYRDYHRTVNDGIGYGGFLDAVLIGDKIFATTYYTTDYAADEYKYDLAEIDLATSSVIYQYFPFTATKYWTNDDFRDCGNIHPCTSTTELIIGGLAQPVVFNYTTYEWTYTDYDAEDSGPPGSTWLRVIYDPTFDCFLGWKQDGYLYYLPRNGVANAAKYVTGAYSSGWTFADPATLIYGYTLANIRICQSEADETWFFWRDTSDSPITLSWGKTNAQRDLSAYLTGELSLEWSLDGTPSKAIFTLTHGHLFDPSNATSILNFYLDKGNKAIVRLGERVGGVNYWANQGTYVIREIALHYKRGEYPTAQISCEDLRCMWDIHQIAATQVTTSYPEDAIRAIVKADTPLTDDDFDLPVFDGRFTFDAAWVDAYLKDIVEDIANRFEYFLIPDMDNKVTARKIDPSAAVSNAYASTAQIIEYTPDDSYSDLANRITVTGQSLDDIEVVYAEERLAGLAGTVGWWGFKKDFYVYYSEDKSKRAKFPRLKVLESSTSILFKLAGQISEKISYVDTDHKYCIVEVSAPNLIPVLLSAIAIYIAGNQVGDIVVSWGGGKTIPLGRKMEGVGVMLALMVLGSVGNYQFEIWGMPCGYVKRDYAASSNDETLQQKIGMVIEQKHEGFACHTQDQCQDVADFEMTVAQLQRNRVKFSKLAHLQDEVGDVISVPHPYTGNTVTFLIASLKRRYKPSGINVGDGYFADEIEGWVV